MSNSPMPDSLTASPWCPTRRLAVFVIGASLVACGAPPVLPLPGPRSAAEAASAPPQPEPADAAARRLVFYAEQLRQLPAAELGAEVTRLNGLWAASGNAPAQTLELALALAQTRNPADTARANTLLEPIARTPSPEQQPWQGLARLLLLRVAEQRRLEDALERQGRELRDSQRNVQQLNEKLEALKAIERSLNNRAPAASAPAAATAPKP